MFRHYVPVLYVYLLCSSVCPGALTEQPWEQRVQQLEIGLHKVSQLLEQCSTNMDVMREEMEQCTSKVGDMRAEMMVTHSDMDDFVGEITRQVDDVNTKVDDVNTKVDDVNTKVDDVNTKVDDVAHGITTNMSDVIDDIREEITDVKESSVSMTDIGTSYVRWGRNNCPLGEDRVYSGIMSGTHPSHNSGTNYQCLPLNPEYANFASGQHNHGMIYGAEYQGVADTVYDMTNLAGSTFINQNVPCSLCHATNRTTIQMFPAKTQCPAGWTLEYWGYLVSSHVGSGSQMSYECMDNAPGAIYNGGADQDAVDIYNVEVDFHTSYVLPCPEYIDGYELTCVVCTK